MSKIMLFKTWFWKEHLVLVCTLKRKKTFQCGVKNNFLNSLNLIFKNSKNIEGWFVLRPSLIPSTFHSTKINNLFKRVSTFMEVRSWCMRKLGNNIDGKSHLFSLGQGGRGQFLWFVFLERGNQWIDNKFNKGVGKWENSWGPLEFLGRISIIHWTSVNFVS